MLQPTPTPCTCGRTHAPLDVRVVIGEGALAALAPIAEAAGGAPVLLFDAVTFSLLGERLIAALGPLGEQAAPLLLGAPGKPFEPNSEAIAAVLAAARDARGLIIGVGSGAINDLGKYAAAQLGRPYACVATAPSMDGYAAPISALYLDGVKTTVDSKRPDAIVAELDVLLGAPAPLVAAGFGDVLGKLTSLTDWGLGRALLDEYYCERIAGDVRQVALDVYKRAGEIAQRTPAALGKLMEALVATGLSVSYVGNSRPTSGAEHLVSHFVEMWSLNRDLRPPAHGHVVGVATLCASEIARALSARTADDLPEVAPPIGQTLPEVLDALKLAERPGNIGLSKFSPEERSERLAQIRARWAQIVPVLAQAPPPGALRAALAEVGAPTRFSELGLEPETVREALHCARYVRERYTLLDLAADTGALDALVDRLVEDYA